jgi:hypothetical protein
MTAVDRQIIPDEGEEDEIPTQLPKEYQDYADVFSEKRSNVLAPHRPYDLKIDLEEGTKPAVGPIYPVSESELGELKAFIEENLRHGFIQQSTSPHGAPILFVKKKDGSLRLCVDYRGLNKITKRDNYPLPLLNDLLEVPHRARIYTKIDLRHAYHLVRIRDGDEWKTTFRTRYGAFEWNVMPFGLSNAPAAFQRFMNTIFADLLDISVIVYLDDILIYSEDEKNHTRDVIEVLKRLREHGLYARADKCEFGVTETEYLGFVLTVGGVRMDPKKIQTILDWPTPRKVKDVQSFLGFANFYRRFIHGYSDKVRPLNIAIKKGTIWNWTKECETAFEDLKQAFVTAPVLAHWIPGRKLLVETDASDGAIAAILSQKEPDGEIRPLAYFSRTLQGSEKNYDVHDKELLAIFIAFKQWRHYLEGAREVIDVFTDHKNLEYFTTTKVLSRRQARWSEYLSAFNLLIHFRPGKLGGKPDALTRRWDVYGRDTDSSYVELNEENKRPIFLTEALNASIRATALMEPVLRAGNVEEPIDVEMLHEDIREAQEVDEIFGPMLSDPPTGYSVVDGMLFKDDRIVVPTPDLQRQVINLYHDAPISGHFGTKRTKLNIQLGYWWKGMNGSIGMYVKTCLTCKRGKSTRHRPYGFLQQLPVPDRPWQSIQMDLIEQLPSSWDGYTAILVILDRFSKQAIFLPTHDDLDTPELARLFLFHVFAKHGVPSHITSDRGSEFVSRFWRSLSAALGVELHYTSGYHPAANGGVERLNQTLETYLRMYSNYRQDNWSRMLPLAEFAYNNTPQESTGVTPFFANKGYHPAFTVQNNITFTAMRAKVFTTDLDMVHKEVKRHLLDAQEYTKPYADAKRSAPPDFEVGSLVMLKAKYLKSERYSRKLDDEYKGPFKITKKIGRNSVELDMSHRSRVHPVWHVSMIEPIEEDKSGRPKPRVEPEEIEGETEWEVEEIVDSRIVARREKDNLEYRAKWLGFDDNDKERYSWGPASWYKNAEDKVEEFHLANPEAVGPDEEEDWQRRRKEAKAQGAREPKPPKKGPRRRTLVPLPARLRGLSLNRGVLLRPDNQPIGNPDNPDLNNYVKPISRHWGTTGPRRRGPPAIYERDTHLC